jgi:isopentenyl-diphosphate Delta-isomerase
MVSQNPSEIFDVVDEEDKVIGQASRKLVHEKGLIHRSVHILVFNSQNRLFLQKRSLQKDENPDLWDSSASGHVNSGENYDKSASRELWEELGIKAKINFWIKLSAAEKTLWEHVSVYKCISDDKMTLAPDEISDGKFWDIEELKYLIESDSEKFTSTLKIIFGRLIRSMDSN